MSQPPSTLLVRVRKLLDKAEGTDNPHEAEAFARKAADLVARHRIDPEHLADVRADDELEIVEINLGRGAYVRGRLALLMAVADANDVRVVFAPTAVGTIAYAAGYRSDLAIVEMMYQSLHQQAAGQMAAIKRRTGAATQRYRRSFLFGFAGRVGELLAEARSSADSDMAADASPGAALALRERTARVDEFAHRSWGRVRSAAPARAVGQDGWTSGARAADGADLGRTRLAGRRRELGP